jgi:ribonuclease HepT-like protein
MNEKFLILQRSIQNDLTTIGGIYEALGSPELEETESQEPMIVIAYRLHSLYTAFENIFRNIATTFENRMEQTGWHRQLLERMRLDLSPIRPAVIDAAAYDKLDEMLRFRHVFRTMYGMDLDPLRLQVVLRKALDLKPLYQEQIGRFLEFLRALE